YPIPPSLLVTGLLPRGGGLARREFFGAAENPGRETGFPQVSWSTTGVEQARNTIAGQSCSPRQAPRKERLMPIYMHFDGIHGSVTAHGFHKGIELDSAQLSVHRHITNPTGHGCNREASAPSIGEIVITKVLDCASTGLFKASLWGEGKKVKIDFCK